MFAYFLQNLNQTELFSDLHVVDLLVNLVVRIPLDSFDDLHLGGRFGHEGGPGRIEVNPAFATGFVAQETHQRACSFH
jgi:hypothetical protein